MKHLGDITKISGHTAPIVDCIIGGSPCQGLSQAGLRKGLDDERSELYLEQVRIVKEMRSEDEARGRAGVDIRPRYMVWENVVGALSTGTPKGEDFRIVLEEIAKIADKNAVIPRPADGKWRTSGCIMGDGWSIAWRVLDAQFWGTSDKPLPQRRRRIALVADFGGQSAPEILFVRKSVSGDIEPSLPKRKEAPSDAQGGIGADDCFGFDGYNGELTGDKQATLGVNCGISTGRNGVLGFHLLQDPIESEDKTPCMGTGNNKNGQASIGVVYGVDAYNQTLTGDVAKSLNSAATDTDHIPSVVYSVENHPNDNRMGTGEGNVPMVMRHYSKSKRAHSTTDTETWVERDTANTLNCFDVGDVRTNEVVVLALDRASFNQGKNAQFDFEISDKGVNSPLVAKGPGAVCYEQTKTRYIVRRLTPLECERLQGYPDGWTDIGEWTDSSGKKRQTSDAARYKALGNSISLPNWKWVLKRLCACYERDATMASLFDGIGGFPYLWEQLNGKGSCLWASEIEEFAIAVTKVRIGS